MNKIQIVNFLLTRKCNLNCLYCGISSDYDDKPSEYPTISHYHKNEISTERIINFLKKLKLHNPDAFIIWYGGEPMLRFDLPEIINYCNDNQINYTIISNCSKQIKPLIFEKLIKCVDEIKGFSASIDPAILSSYFKTKKPDEYEKSYFGFSTLKQLKESNIVKDVVAEVTVSNDDIDHLLTLIRFLSKNNINSDITFVDIAKNKYYDFSNIYDDKVLVDKTQNIRNIINSIISEKLNVHMAETLLPEIYNILPSNLDCQIDKNLHNICVDADGTMRLCLRIRGVSTPNTINVENCFDEHNNVSINFIENIKIDKDKYCEKCNHTCYIMSKLISENPNNVTELIHSKIRNG